jgi:DNA modification methylase
VRSRDYKLASSVWDDIPQVCSYRKQLHPTEKPVECARRMLLASSAEGDLVYIPFAGSGSELEACESLNRRWIASDTDPLCARAAQERVNAAVRQP